MGLARAQVRAVILEADRGKLFDRVRSRGKASGVVFMRPDFGEPYGADFAGHPAHMSAIDFVLWRRLRARGDLVFDRVFFDVAVGRGVDSAPDVAAGIRAAWARLTRLRIDVVSESASVWTLVEIRGAAGPGAIGSLLTYRSLWRDDPPDDRPVNLVLVTDLFPENLLPVLAEFSILLLVV